MPNNKCSLTEGLERGDLKDFVSDLFTIDQYRSKMGEDSEIVVLGFKVREKYPAIDLMEFIEKGYSFILDADISAGEEQDGQYQVFVEMERTPKLPGQLKHLFDGVSQLCDCYEWRFRYQKAKSSEPFNEETIQKNVPMTKESYEQKINQMKGSEIQEFFDQGAVEVNLESSNILNFTKPYSGSISAKLVSMGDFEQVKDTLPGAISLDESSQGEIFFLTKYLGNYDINKIGNKFLIRNGTKAIVIEKDRW